MAQVGVGARAPGDWAALSATPLRALDAELAHALREPIGRGREGLESVAFGASGDPIEGSAAAELYDAAMAQALTLVAARMGDAGVIEDPSASGLVLLRLEAQPDAVVLEFAPALAGDGWRGRAVDVEVDELTLIRGADAGARAAAVGEPEFSTVSVQLDGVQAALPVARLRYEASGARGPSRWGAQVTARLPKLWLPGAPDPVLDLRLEAEALGAEAD